MMMRRYQFKRNIFDAKSFNHEMNSYCFVINPSNNVAQRVGLAQLLRIKQAFMNAFEVMKAYTNDHFPNISLFDLLVHKNCNVMLNYQYLHQFHVEARNQQQNAIIQQEEEEEEEEEEEDDDDDVITNDTSSYNYDAYDGLIDNGYNYNYYNVPYHKSPFKGNNEHRYHQSN
eukprot:374237_1